LANIDVAKAKKGGYYTSQELSNIVERNNVRVIIIYEKWFENNIPPDWIKVSDWEIQNNIVCGDSKVSFYVTDSKEKENLIKNIKIFCSNLPSDIKVKIYH